MALNRKVAIIIVTVFTISALASMAIQQALIMPSFLDLERQFATQNTERVLEAVSRELEQVSPSVTDWAHWTDTYEYAKGQAPDYASENLEIDTTLPALSMNFLAIYDASGKLLFAEAVDLESAESLTLGALTETGLPQTHPLLHHTGLLDEVTGILQTPHAPLLVVSKPILTSAQEGPAAGSFMMGRFLDERAVRQIEEQTRLPVNLVAVDAAPADKASPNGGLTHTPVTLSEQEERWQGSSTLFDLFGAPVLEIQVSSSRDISARGASAVGLSLWSLAATGVIMMAVMWWMLRYTLLRPLTLLTRHAVRVGTEDRLDDHIDMKREDEIGVLARNFDDMVDRLAETRRRLVDQSFHSGVAEMASGVLHNIGNALTPLTVNLQNLRRELHEAPLAEVEQASSELQAPVASAQRRDDLMEFVRLASTDLAALVRRNREAANAASTQVSHIQEILADQERFSRSKRVIEPVDLGCVIEDAYKALETKAAAALRMELTPQLSDLGAVAGSRAALQQVVTNVLLNAAVSVSSTEAGSGRVIITADVSEMNGVMQMHLCFEDNGVGIDPEHLRRVFERGFTTKDREGSGHGLHWSANTLQALHGSIRMESPGCGKGASLHIHLPLAEHAGAKATGTGG
jgi:sensor domain CHASE-containing protein/anti-sigma regulatory factor (Ser/Thr protein kinase)